MRPLLITFSGVDGAGKSTQISNLRRLIEAWGMTSELRTFWDDAVVLSRYREKFVQSVLKSESGVGSPERPVERRDKNVQSWPLNLVRHGLYYLDAINVGRVIHRASRSNPDVIILDRYVYDELANLPLDSKTTRGYINGIARLIPQPDIAFVLDANPEAARKRKPEYPLEFIQQNRMSYLRLAVLLGTLTVVPATSLDEAKHLVEMSFGRVLDARNRACKVASGVWAA